MRVLVTATNPDGSAQPRQRPERDRAGRAAGQHERAVHHRHAAARDDADRLAGDLERRRGTPTPTSGSATPAPATRTSPARPATTYTLGVADVGARIRVRVTATNPDATRDGLQHRLGRRAGRPAGRHRARRRSPAPPGAPSTLTSTRRRRGAASATSYAYQWQRRAPAGASVNIAGATGATYTLDAADVGAEIRLRVTATNPDGTLSATSAATAVVQPRRRATPRCRAQRPGEARRHADGRAGRLDARPGDSRTSGSATASTSPARRARPTRCGAADVGKRVRVKVTATNVDGSASAISAATDAGRRAAGEHGRAGRADRDAARGVHAHRRRGHLGHAERDADLHLAALPGRATVSTRTASEVGTGSTYTLSDADVGRRLGVRVTATSSGGTTTVAGALTAVVGAARRWPTSRRRAWPATRTWGRP